MAVLILLLPQLRFLRFVLSCIFFRLAGKVAVPLSGESTFVNVNLVTIFWFLLWLWVVACPSCHGLDSCRRPILSASGEFQRIPLAGCAAELQHGAHIWERPQRHRCCQCFSKPCRVLVPPHRPRHRRLRLQVMYTSLLVNRLPQPHMHLTVTNPGPASPPVLPKSPSEKLLDRLDDVQRHTFTQLWKRLSVHLEYIVFDPHDPAMSNLKPSSGKARIGSSHANFFGRTTSPAGVSPKGDKVRALTHMPDPANIKQSRSPLGDLRYCSK